MFGHSYGRHALNDAGAYLTNTAAVARAHSHGPVPSAPRRRCLDYPHAGQRRRLPRGDDQ